jgi:lipoate-protein ligase A
MREDDAVMPTCRVLPWRVADGPWQMAADEALLETAANRDAASLRFYGWSQATVSLGYFQPDASRGSDPRLAALPRVRRATGGATLVHDREVAYALALPSGQPWQARDRPWLRRMHAIIARAFAQLHVNLRLVGEKEEKKQSDVLCFLHQTPGDLLCDEAKVVGSAQRKQRGALLQHGGILLEQSRHTPGLPGMHELAGLAQGSENVVIAAVRQAFTQETGWELIDAEWTPEERQRIDELIAARYGNEAWNAKR